ncbi:autophagy protein [Ascosphaera pollenicola]|nr:autophagy protein [Ascosphaera pollenicola]
MATSIVRSRSPSPSLSDHDSTTEGSVTLSTYRPPPASAEASTTTVTEPLTKQLHLSSVEVESDDGSWSTASEIDDNSSSFVLYPPTAYPRHPGLAGAYSIDIDQLANALTQLAKLPLLDKSEIFPWMHVFPPIHEGSSFTSLDDGDGDGDDDESVVEEELRPPQSLRSIMLLKAGGDLTKSKLKGTVDACEIVDDCMTRFRSDAEMVEGKIRHFKLQTQKFANVSDIIIYGDEDTTSFQIDNLAARIIDCQHHANQKFPKTRSDYRRFNTFILSSSFQDVCRKYPELVYIDSAQNLTPHAIDMVDMEKRQISNAAAPSQIAPNVWVSSMMPPPYDHPFPDGRPYDIYIDTQEVVDFPEQQKLEEETHKLRSVTNYFSMIQFPGTAETSKLPVPEKKDSIIETCKWIHQLSTADQEPNQSGDQIGDKVMLPKGLLHTTSSNLRVLIHCLDGYSEVSLLALAYLMFTERLSIHEALIYLHRDINRDFYLQPSDVKFLQNIQWKLVTAGKKAFGKSKPKSLPPAPSWVETLETCLPSRITTYMYLGNLKHANQPKLLKALGITRILGVGEPLSWLQHEIDEWGIQNMILIRDVGDNGCDSLYDHFERALGFIEHGRKNGMITFVHCRVGVSRSATICIAEAMMTQGLSLPEAL